MSTGGRCARRHSGRARRPQRRRVQGRHWVRQVVAREHDDAVEADPEAKVVVAQPRRLAAIALARRVAHERTEVVGGAKGLVGYRVGHASKAGPKVRLTFATVGWLLQKLVHFVADGHATDGGSSGAQGSQFDYTVVIVDEVRLGYMWASAYLLFIFTPGSDHFLLSSVSDL